MIHYYSSSAMLIAMLFKWALGCVISHPRAHSHHCIEKCCGASFFFQYHAAKADISKTLKLTLEQFRWLNSTRGKKKSLKNSGFSGSTVLYILSPVSIYYHHKIHTYLFL